MTWDARDIATGGPLAPMQSPADSPSSLNGIPPPLAIPPVQPGAFVDGESPLETFWGTLPPGEREMAVRSGYIPGGFWERWSHMVTRGIDGIAE